MWLRFLVIICLNFLVTFVTILLATIYILPEQTPVFAINLTSWIVAFILSCLFSSWAFSKQIPRRHDALLLVMLRCLVSLTGYLLFGILISDQGPAVVASPELLIQLALEVLAILLMTFQIRKRKIQTMLGEGMEI